MNQKNTNGTMGLNMQTTGKKNNFLRGFTKFNNTKNEVGVCGNQI